MKSQVQWYMPVIPATQETGVGGSQSEASLGKSIRLFLKNKLKAKDWGVTQVVELLLSQCEALSSIPRTTKKKRVAETSPAVT
jgi:hypothetical protein